MSRRLTQDDIDRLIAAARHGRMPSEHRIRFLPLEELVEVLGSERRTDLIIGVEAILDRSEIVLYRGNFESITLPLEWFAQRFDISPQPDPNRCSVADFGQTVCLGEYEASTDAILFEFDEDYRARARAREFR